MVEEGERCGRDRGIDVTADAGWLTRQQPTHSRTARHTTDRRGRSGTQGKARTNMMHPNCRGHRTQPGPPKSGRLHLHGLGSMQRPPRHPAGHCHWPEVEDSLSSLLTGRKVGVSRDSLALDCLPRLVSSDRNAKLPVPTSLPHYTTVHMYVLFFFFTSVA